MKCGCFEDFLHLSVSASSAALMAKATWRRALKAIESWQSAIQRMSGNGESQLPSKQLLAAILNIRGLAAAIGVTAITGESWRNVKIF